MGMMAQVGRSHSSPPPASHTHPPFRPVDFFSASGSSGLVRESFPQRELWQRCRVDLAHHRPAHCRADVFPRLLRPTLRRDHVASHASSSFHAIVCKPNKCQTEE